MKKSLPYCRGWTYGPQKGMKTGDFRCPVFNQLRCVFDRAVGPARSRMAERVNKCLPSLSHDNFGDAVQQRELVGSGIRDKLLGLLEQVGVFLFVREESAGRKSQAFGDAKDRLQAGFALAAFY